MKKSIGGNCFGFIQLLIFGFSGCMTACDVCLLCEITPIFNQDDRGFLWCFLLISGTDTDVRLTNKKLLLNVPDYLLLHNLIL